MKMSRVVNGQAYNFYHLHIQHEKSLRNGELSAHFYHISDNNNYSIFKIAFYAPNVHCFKWVPFAVVSYQNEIELCFV